MNHRWNSAVHSVPCAGHRDIGDAAWINQSERCWRTLLVDASGHGTRAHQLCRRIEESRGFSLDGDLVLLLGHLHEALKGTAGAAAMAAEVLWQGDHARLRYVGVGNVRLWVDAREDFSDEGLPGLLGTRLPTRLELREHILNEGDRLALVTDGIRSTARKMLAGAATGVQDLATRLVQEHARSHDDATCVLLCLRRPS